MTVKITLKGNRISGELNRKKADEIARRVAKAAHARALSAWHPSNKRSQLVFADCAYSAAYEVALAKAISKHK